MPGSSPSGVDNSISPTIMHSTSVTAPGSSNSITPHSSTVFSSFSLSIPTSSTTTAPDTPNRPLSTSHSPQTTNSSASSTGHVDSSSISSETSAISATSTLTANQEPDASSLISSSPVLRTQVPLNTLAATPHSTIPAQHDPLTPFGSASSTSTTQSEYAAYDFSTVSSMYSSTPYLTPASAASGVSSIWATFSTDHRGHSTGTSSSDLALQPTPTSVPTPTPAFVSSVVTETTISLQSPSHFHHVHHHDFTKRPNKLIPTDPDLITVVTQTTRSGTILEKTITLESIGSESPILVPTTSSSVSPNSSPSFNSPLSLILGLVLGVLSIVILSVTLFWCRARRRYQYPSNTLLRDSGSSRERQDRMIAADTSRSNADTQITSYRPSLTSDITICVSHAGGSFQSGGEQLSDPFADGSSIASSRTSMPPMGARSVDSLSTMQFLEPLNTDTRDVVVSRRLTEAGTTASASSLELQFVAPPLATHVSLTHSPYWSPTWHYDGQSSSGTGEYRNEEPRSDASHVAPAAPSKPFFLGTGSARLRLHALLKEARRV